MKLSHFWRTAKQLMAGKAIGRRGTPVVSFWPMRAKWEAFGYYWEQFGTDGDLMMTPKGLTAPAELQLVYIRIPVMNKVCQLAYVLYPEGPETAETARSRMDAMNENIKFATRAKGIRRIAS